MLSVRSLGSPKCSTELGVLRALGMSGAQVSVALTVEQLLLVLVGIAAGTGIGLLAAQLVVPLPRGADMAPFLTDLLAQLVPPEQEAAAPA